MIPSRDDFLLKIIKLWGNSPSLSQFESCPDTDTLLVKEKKGMSKAVKKLIFINKPQSNLWGQGMFGSQETPEIQKIPFNPFFSKSGKLNQWMLFKTSVDGIWQLFVTGDRGNDRIFNIYLRLWTYEVNEWIRHWVTYHRWVLGMFGLFFTKWLQD